MERIRGYILIALGSLVMSAITIFGKLALDYPIRPESIIALRFIISFSVLSSLLLLLRREFFKIHVHDLPSFLVLGVIATALQRVVYFYALKYVSATTAIILVFTYPVFITIIASLFYDERITKSTILAIVFSLGGVMLVIKIYEQDASIPNLLGIAFGLCASLLFVLYFFLVKCLRSRYTNWTLIAYGDGIGALALVFLLLPNVAEILAYPARLWVLILGVGVSSLLGYLIFSYALKYVASSKGSILMVIEPLGIVIMSSLFLRERIDLLQWVGIILALAGIAFLFHKSEK